jgi:uncharacterized integral membrane protein
MKKMKIAFWVVVILLSALLIIQNQTFFFEKTSFGLDFYYKKYQTPGMPNVILFLVFFFIGLLIAYIFNLLGQFKAKKTIKNLNITIQSQMEVISGLKSEIATKDAQIEQFTSRKTEPEQEAATTAEQSTSIDVDPTL